MIPNSWKHAAVGVVCAVIFTTVSTLINLIPNTQLNLGWFAVFGFALGTIFWEYWQYVAYGNKPFWWHFRGLDTLLDLVCGNGAFILIMFLLGQL